MNWSSCGTACAALVLLTACAAGDSATDTASAPSTAPSATATATTSTASTPSPTAAPEAEPTATRTTPPPSSTADCASIATYEGSATCLYDAFRGQDQGAASRHASPEALEALFALGGYPTDDQWTFEGCSSGRETSPSSGVACHYVIPGEVHPVYVELAMRDDFVVERVQSIG